MCCQMPLCFVLVHVYKIIIIFYFVPVCFVLLQNCITSGDRKVSPVLPREQEMYGDPYSFQ